MLSCYVVVESDKIKTLWYMSNSDVAVGIYCMLDTVLSSLPNFMTCMWPRSSLALELTDDKLIFTVFTQLLRRTIWASAQHTQSVGSSSLKCNVLHGTPGVIWIKVCSSKTGTNDKAKIRSCPNQAWWTNVVFFFP